MYPCVSHIWLINVIYLKVINIAFITFPLPGKPQPRCLKSHTWAPFSGIVAFLLESYHFPGKVGERSDFLGSGLTTAPVHVISFISSLIDSHC